MTENNFIWVLIEKEEYLTKEGNYWITEDGRHITKRLKQCSNIYVIEGGQIDSKETLKDLEQSLLNPNENTQSQNNIVYTKHQNQESLNKKTELIEYIKSKKSYEYSINDNEIRIFNDSDQQFQNKKINYLNEQSKESEYGIKDILYSKDPKLYQKIPELFQQLDKQKETDDQITGLANLNLYISTLKVLLKTRQNMDSVSETLTVNLDKLLSKLKKNKNLFQSTESQNDIEELNSAVNELKKESVETQKLQNTIDSCNELTAKFNEMMQQNKTNKN